MLNISIQSLLYDALILRIQIFFSLLLNNSKFLGNIPTENIFNLFCCFVTKSINIF